MAVYDKNGRMIKSAKLKPNETHNVFEWQQIFNRAINFTNWIDKYYVDAAKFHKAMVRYYEMEDIDIAEYVSACLALIGDSNFKKDLLRLVKEHFHVDLEPITSSRKPVKSSFVINYYDEAGYQSNNFIDANAKGLVSSPIGAMTFETREDAQEWIDTQAEKNVFDPEYCEIQSVDEIQSSRKPVKSAVDEAGYEYDYGKVDELCQKASDEMGGDRDALFFSSSTFRDYDGFMLKGHYLEQIVNEFGDDPETIWTALCTELGMGDFSAQAIGEDWLNYTLFVKWAGSPQGIESSLSRNENSMNVVFGK